MANSRTAKRPRKPDARKIADHQRLVRLGRALADARAAQHLTLREVAATIGRGVSTVCDYEAGRREPPGLVLLDLMAALGVAGKRLDA